MSVTLPTRVHISEHVISQELEDDCVLLDMASEQYYGLDDVGARIWQFFTEEDDIDAILTRLRAYYGADEGTLRHDLAAFISQLQAEGLVNVQTG